MTQEKADKIFATGLWQQLDVIYVTSDDQPFIRHEEAENYCHDILEEGDDVSKYNITEWYPSDISESEIKPTCSTHTKSVAGITDMKLLAEMVGDLHYETLREFLLRLEVKLLIDSEKDAIGNRMKLSDALLVASGKIGEAVHFINKAWNISRPFMGNNIVGEDMVCPVTKEHCDDECCTAGAVCNLSGN